LEDMLRSDFHGRAKRLMNAGPERPPRSSNEERFYVLGYPPD
jgi:hypothetical protein